MDYEIRLNYNYLYYHKTPNENYSCNHRHISTKNGHFPFIFPLPFFCLVFLAIFVRIMHFPNGFMVGWWKLLRFAENNWRNWKDNLLTRIFIGYTWKGLADMHTFDIKNGLWIIAGHKIINFASQYTLSLDAASAT